MRVLTKLILAATVTVAVTSGATAADYYKVTPHFIPYPQPGKSWSIRQYGPVGIGINLINPAFTIQITGIEKGSPAEATGKLKKGQIIESINGQTLKDIDPRVQLANILAEAEATDGKMNLKIKDLGVVTVQLPLMGRYSKTWPLNCPKSEKIIRNFCDHYANLEKPDWTAGVFLMSTGEDKDVAVMRRWLKQEGVPSWTYPWHIGYRGPGICEYYLRTGDASVLPGIKKLADELKSSMYNGSWMGRGSKTPNYKYMGGGHMNAAGVHALNFLLLARQCGVEVDEYLLQRVLFQFFRYAGRGNVAYGDQMPEGGFRDNGKSAGLAVAMSSAAGLAPEGESSVYAKVRDNSAMKSFYATTWFNRAHTGGGIGEIWHGVAMQLMVDKKPLQHRSFNDERLWFYELSRRFDGTFSISDNGGSYDKKEWGNYFALFYTAPRKKLRMFGAPATQWCKTHPLPKRPWGTAADDAFYSMKPGEYKPGKVEDISREDIPKSASGPFMTRLSEEASDDVFLMTAHHPEYAFRSATARSLVKQQRYHLIVPLLTSPDPRVREVGALCVAGMFKGSPMPPDKITDEIYGLLVKMVNNPQESRWGTIAALKGLNRLPKEKVEPLVDRLLALLKEDDWWIQSVALSPLCKVATDPAYYRKVLPAVGVTLANNTACSLPGSTRDLGKLLPAAKPDVQQFALQVFSRTYDAMPDPLIAPGGANLQSGLSMFKGTVGSFMKAVPGGSQSLLTMPKQTSRWQTSRKSSDRYVYNGKFTANKAIMGNWKTIDQVNSIPDFQKKLADEATARAKEAAAKKAGKKPKKKAPPKKKSYGLSGLSLADGGNVPSSKGGGLRWSGSALIDLGSHEALAMGVKTIDAKEYLFVECGGFSATHPPEWHTKYYVMVRK